MKRIFFGMLLATLCTTAQAGTLVIDNSSSVSFSGYDGQPLDATGVQTSGFWGSLYATTAGIFSATYLGQESAFTDGFSFGLGKDALKEGFDVGTTISQFVKAGTVKFKFMDNNGWDGISGHTFWNGQSQTSSIGFAIMEGQENKYGKFDYILGFNDSYKGDADYDDFVVGINFAPVPEPQTYAMILAGLGLLGASVRRRKSGLFD